MKTIGLAQALIAFTLWSSLGVFFNWFSLPQSVYVSVGSLIALCLMYTYSLLTNRPINPPLTLPLAGIFLTAAIKGAIWFRALQIYPIAPAMILHNLAPIIALILAPLLIHEAPRIQHGFAAVTGLLGLIFVLNLPSQQILTLEWGAVLALIAALASGIQDVCHRAAKTSAFNQTFVFILGQAVGGTLSLLSSSPITFTWNNIFEIGYFALIGTILPLLLLTQSFKTLRSFEVALLGYSEPILGSLWASLFLDQPLTPTTILGAALIFLSGLAAIDRQLPKA